MSADNRFQTLEQVRERLNTDHDRLGNWDAVSMLYELHTGTVWNIAHGHDPADPEVRHKLGLPPIIGSDTGYRPPQTCEVDGCYNVFVSNHPKRRKCFECSPYRGKEL